MNFKEEYIRCLKDKSRVYFIENYLSTFDADKGTKHRFILFPRQIAYLNSLVDNRNIIAIKHRQCGCTTVTSAWVTGQIVFASKNAPETVLCIGNKLDISQQLIEKIGDFLDQVPRWMWGSDYYSPDPESLKNTKSIYKARNKQYIELFNGCRVYARSSGENAARGISAANLVIFDEAAFIQNGIMVYSQAVATTASVKDSRVVVISTPNGKDQLYYQLYSKAVSGQNNFTPVVFKWFQDLRYNRNLKWYKKDSETGEMMCDADKIIASDGSIEYNEERWAKLEKEGWKPNNPWYEDMCKTFNNDEQRIAQELDISFLGSSDNVIPVDVIEAQKEQNVVTITEDWPYKDPLVKETWVFKLPVEGHRYICSCDSSSGSGEDRTAIEIIDVDATDEDGRPFYEQVLEYYGKMNGDEVGELLYQYGNMYNQALIVLDGIGGYSDAAILTLLRLKYKNLYYDDPGLKTYTVEKDYIKFNIKKGEKLPGFRTNNMRIQMFTNFVGLVKDNMFRVKSIRVITEMETWVFRNGRPDHMDGCHDDALYSLSMGLFVMQYSMLRNAGYKTKSAVMLNAWTSNNANNTNYFTRQSDVKSISPQQTKPNPFNSMLENSRNSLKGCLLLGGFRPKKKS
jgi:TPR repeat protein